MPETELNPRSFGASFQTFMQQMVAQAPAEEPELRRRVREHFGTEPAVLPIVSERLAKYEHANLHLAVEKYLSEGGRSYDLIGIASAHEMFAVRLAHLVVPAGIASRGTATIGPVEYVNLQVDDQRVLPCVQCGLFLCRRNEERFAIFISSSHGGFREQLSAEVMAPTREASEAILAHLRNSMRQRSVYRGRVVSLHSTRDGSIEVRFHRLPEVGRNDIVLPEGLLERIERQAVRFAELRDQLKAMGRHLKRGLLLHGPPGTGKTLTAMHLAGRMRDRTVILLTGRGLGLVEHSCALARFLEPATVIIEDVDLIAEERTRQDNCNSLLFELLNQMDGFSDDADVLFILTTNRPELLEPALAARPGRIDQAVEIPSPDEGCRSRLLDLYAKGLELRLERRASLLAKTRGVSAAFVRELLRKAALTVADEGPGRVVDDRHMEGALRELVVEGGRLTQCLLGSAGMPLDAEREPTAQ